jgi:hypothetical protein
MRALIVEMLDLGSLFFAILTYSLAVAWGGI